MPLRLAALRPCAALLLLAPLVSCGDGGTEPVPDRTVTIALTPQLAVPAPSSTSALTSTLVATDAASGREVGRDEFDYMTATLPLPLEVRVPGGTDASVMVTMEVRTSSRIEWSGRVGPLTLREDATTASAVVVLGRGSLENLAVTGIELAVPNATLVEGDSVKPGVSVSGAPGAKVFWRSLEESIAITNDTGLVKTLRNGTARIVAMAGTKADTVALTVAQLPSSIWFEADSLRFTSLAVWKFFNAHALDPRGELVGGPPMEWTVADTTIVKHVGGGMFVSVGNGVTAITATVVGRPSLTRTTGARVTQVLGQVTMFPETAALAGVGAADTLYANPADSTNNRMPIVASECSWTTSDPSVATVSPAGGNGMTCWGAVTAAGGGTAWIRVTIGGKSDSTVVRVVDAAAATVTIVEGSGGTARVGTAAPGLPTVRVTDIAGVPVPGVPVTFAVTSGGGHLIPSFITGAASSYTVRTGTDGIARIQAWVLGTAAGVNTLTVTAGRLPPVTFTATGTPGIAVALHAVSTQNQTATTGSLLGVPLVVEARDGFGNAVPNVPVTWRAPLGGRPLPLSPFTDHAGRAEAQFVPGFGSDFQYVVATSPGLDSTFAHFNVHVLAPGISVWGPVVVGSGLQDSVLIELRALPPAGGVVVRVASADPTVALVSSSATVAGTPAIDVRVPEGSRLFWVWVQGEGAATARDTLRTTLDVTAPQYLPGSNSVSVVASTFELSVPPVPSAVGATFPIHVRVGRAFVMPGDAVAAAVHVEQPVRAGAPLTFTITVGDSTIATLVTPAGDRATATLEISSGRSRSAEGVANEGVSLKGLSMGMTTFSASSPVLSRSGNATRWVDVRP